MGKPNSINKSQRNKSDLGEDFIAPDGGWGWIVCIAGGLSNLCIMPVIATFGLIFREELNILGFNNSEITTIINVQQAVSLCTGLINGPMYRRFSYRQVGLTGSSIVGFSIFLISTANSFITYLIYFSILCGFGMGISVSATALALNTYFKEKRRRASSLSWTVTGLGPLIMPFVITNLLHKYGVRGTVLILGALSLNSIACALIYQPVEWHSSDSIKDNENIQSNTMRRISKSMTSIFSSQYLYNEDNENERGYEITTPGIPMLIRANDGWYGSKFSLKSNGLNNSKISIVLNNEDLNEKRCLKPNNFYRELEFRKSTSTNSLYAKTKNGYMNCKCSDAEQNKSFNDNKINKIDDSNIDDSIDYDKNNDNISWYNKIIIFFDLDLLQDITYVNLMLGMTLANFSDLNFSTLTPFFLSDYGFNSDEIALFMSVMAFADIIVRFLTPYIVKNINWDNRIFFLISLVGMVFGRVTVGIAQEFNTVLVMFIWLGMCKGLRTVFLNIIIPSYVPLNRLPAASGLQLLTAGIFTLLVGPIVGVIRDATSTFSFCLNFLNCLSLITVISWSIEIIYSSKKRKLENDILGSSI